MITIDNNFKMSTAQMELLSKLAKKKTGMDVNQLKQSVEDGKFDAFANANMDPDTVAKLKQVLTDKEAAQNLLGSPEAKALLKKLMGGK